MNESEIIGLYNDRSEKAVAETAIVYERLCRKIIGNILSSKEDIEECLNDVYLAVWNSIPPDKPESLCAYICRISRNLALKKYTYNKAGKRDFSKLVPYDELSECAVFDEKDTDGNDARIAEIIGDFLRLQNYENRVVFVKRYWYYQSISEISSELSISESKVKSCLHRMRNKLKKYIEKELRYER